MTKPELPEDLVEEIFCRVPATSLKRLRSTCKRWNRLFNDDWRFARKHLDKATKQFMVLMLTKKHNIALPGEYSAKLDIDRVIHCDGVLLCTSSADNSRIVVWNPLTGEQRWIRSGDRRRGVRDFDIGHCQGDNKSCNKSYRVLKYYYASYAINSFEIYEFNSDTWRSLGDICPGCKYLCLDLSVSLKCIVTHWLTMMTITDT
ncbi:PREDICTED: F-box/kelch-repeat protein At3g44120-like [Camelina sativa]|uniref:F-box/kelch-repeat protein At3g44120-like n=1 Tax=Camelina sativa TaxID=90675 RepID=A0ABM0XRN6_CAMSA|nr:PREDICTED: F-box/kelch-repeat protein At3g44120-like [Camelina sativa]